MDKYGKFEVIGTGSFGTVNKATEKCSQRDVALKMIMKNGYRKNELKNFQKECGIHAKLCHPNIIQMIESFETPDWIVVVTDLAAIDLHKYMRHHPQLAESHVQSLTWDLVSALWYLHSHRIMHRDLKPQNILLNKDGREAKLCDFGLARNMTRETYLLTSMKGTPLYMAPEVINDEPYDQQADLWSLGCILFEMLTGHPPFKGKSLNDLLFLLRNQEIKWPEASENCLSFLRGLLRKNQKTRFNWNAILEHAFVSNHIVFQSDNSVDLPLTKDLTASQNLAKERQRDEIKLLKDKKIIAARAKMCRLAAAAHPTGIKNHNAVEFFAQQHNQAITTDNESISSQDSVNAIVQTDIENIETDVEGTTTKMAENPNLVLQRFAENFAVPTKEQETPSMCELNGNLVIGTMNDNLRNDGLEEHMKRLNLKTNAATYSAVQPAKSTNVKESDTAATLDTGRDLEKRKLCQNLDNFSIRLNATGSNEVVESMRNDTKTRREKESEKPKTVPVVETKVTDCDDYQSSPIENEEWHAFIRTTMREVLSGEIDSLRQSNMVGIIVAILRNFNASTKVIKSVVELLSIPLVLLNEKSELDEIKTIYEQTKLLPNLIFASKLICTQKTIGQSLSSTASSNAISLNLNKENTVYIKLSDMGSDQLAILARIYDLTCILVHSGDNFLTQFCDSVYCIAQDLFTHILSDVCDHQSWNQLISAILALLCYALRELPENADIIEPILFNPSVNLNSLLRSKDPSVKCQICMLLRVVGRFSCFALQKAWTLEMRQSLETLATDDNDNVRDRAKATIDELSSLSFYAVKAKN